MRLAQIRALSLLVVLSLAGSASSIGQPNFQVLHNFPSHDHDGGGLWGSLVIDRKGNLYGTTGGGGVYGDGTVFKLKPQRNGHWSEHILHSFSYKNEGGSPIAGPTLGEAGNLFGTTGYGGTYDDGTVFELSPGLSGWNLVVLHSFDFYGGDGADAWGSLVFDNSGNVFGTTRQGGPNDGGGTVFELSPGDSGWTYNIRHTFCAPPPCTDGASPESGLIFGTDGNLYGTTLGTVFRLKTKNWKEHALHRFHWQKGDREGYMLYGGVVFDQTGNLYGATAGGGTDYRCQGGCGTVFGLSPQPDGHWKETILHTFHMDANGYAPFAGPIVDAAGNLYGTTAWGGTRNGGTVYKLAPQPDGTWKFSVLHRFTGPDGYQSQAALVMDKKGNLYGTTTLGGTGGVGVVFKIKP